MTPDLCECGGDSRVIDSRRRGSAVCRRRVCVECGDRWTTYERRSHVFHREPDEEKTLHVVCPPGKKPERIASALNSHGLYQCDAPSSRPTLP